MPAIAARSIATKRRARPGSKSQEARRRLAGSCGKPVRRPDDGPLGARFAADTGRHLRMRAAERGQKIVTARSVAGRTSASVSGRPASRFSRSRVGLVMCARVGTHTWRASSLSCRSSRRRGAKFDTCRATRHQTTMLTPRSPGRFQARATPRCKRSDLDAPT